jgi:hypothetical protein
MPRPRSLSFTMIEWSEHAGCGSETALALRAVFEISEFRAPANRLSEIELRRDTRVRLIGEGAAEAAPSRSRPGLKGSRPQALGAP